MGTFYFGDQYPAEYTIKNVSHGTGNQEIELVVTSDNGQWDAYVDYLKISGNTGTSGSSTKMVALPFDDGPSSTTNQINWTSSAVKNAVGYDVKFFRPPYLATSNSMYENHDLAFVQGASCNDWESSVSASQRANTILSSVEDGSIILLHDFQGNTNTVQALPTIIEGLQAQGYTFVTVSELFENKGVNPNQEYKIWTNVYQ